MTGRRSVPLVFECFVSLEGRHDSFPFLFDSFHLSHTLYTRTQSLVPPRCSFQVQTRRDGEVLRVKKHYLKLYLATRGIHSVSSPYGENPVDVLPAGDNTTSSLDEYSCPTESIAPNHAPSEIEEVTEPESYQLTPDPCASSRKRSLTCLDLHEPAPARKRRTSSDATNGEQEWRELCQNAKDIFCDSLPGLEEAAIMFGYAAQ